MKKILIIFIMLFSALAACAKTPVKDKELSAIEGGDHTGLIEGCGNQLVAGMMRCKKTEGMSVKGDYLSFLGPITNCKREFCVEFKVYNNRGELVFGDAIPKKKNRKDVEWTKILNRDTFEINDRGMWFYKYTIYWVDGNGNENISVSDGEIYLRIIRDEYIPLDNVVNDRNFVWSFWTKNNELVKMTTGMRTYVSRRTKY